jgi:hypothetical protein
MPVTRISRPALLFVLLAALLAASLPSSVVLEAGGEDPDIELARNPNARQDPPGHQRNGEPNEPAPDPDPTADPDPAPEPEPTTPTPSQPLFGHELAFGVATASNGASDAEIAHVAGLAGESPAIELWYRSFTQELRVSELDAIAARGALPYLTWEPWDWRKGTNQSSYRLSNIYGGSFDGYIERSAETLKEWGDPVLLRFAHEMNGDWYPWSESLNGNSSGDYVRAWNHVQAIFEAVGADNVVWVWSPNVEYPGSIPLAGLYPGVDRVDVIAVDGYNFGTSQTWSSWIDPAQLFDGTFEALRLIAPGVPLILGEVGSSELGGSKSAWIDQLFTWMEAQEDLHAFVWFHLNKETDWRIDSSSSSADSFLTNLTRLRAS